MAVKPQKGGLKLRIPDDLEEWVKRRAKKNVRSMNAEILSILIEKRETDGDDANAPGFASQSLILFDEQPSDALTDEEAEVLSRVLARYERSKK